MAGAKVRGGRMDEWMDGLLGGRMGRWIDLVGERRFRFTACR